MPLPPLVDEPDQPDDGENIGYNTGTLHLGDGVHRSYRNDRRTCAQHRLGEAHPAHDFYYAYRRPEGTVTNGHYYCDGLPDDAEPFDIEPSPSDWAAHRQAAGRPQPVHRSLTDRSS